ncbi:4'-phosphopantetheinyl transferase family protein [Rhabdochromatium marinum]|uniref:4'-phosphopantetheinyl transferase family protein n=1 Tax=Rhabdochromatium marinum TaxID=48729 RepID=UPI001906AB1E|nr:4'-phosphopantetheinyl transferase superfamily protein [Rhabdochromatium marinum]MBK1648440.1 hypothetical protein [Rhabdochromatium marinum]
MSAFIPAIPSTPLPGGADPPLLHWRPAERPPALDDGALHLWRIDADTACMDLEARCQQTLSTAELQRAARLRLSDLRQRFLCSHLASRRILGAYLDCAPQAIYFAYSETGKPRLCAPDGWLEFNLSTTADLTLLAVRRHEPVGVDAEILRQRIDPLAIAQRMFSAAEVEHLSRLQGPALWLAFYAAWTTLEARVKRDGRGLAGHRQPEAANVRVALARPRADAICAIASRCLPPPQAWLTWRWQE